jgi:hypothetical protein
MTSRRATTIVAATLALGSLTACERFLSPVYDSEMGQGDDGGAGGAGHCPDIPPVGRVTFLAVGASTGTGSIDCNLVTGDEAGNEWESICNETDGCRCLFNGAAACSCESESCFDVSCCPDPWR